MPSFKSPVTLPSVNRVAITQPATGSTLSIIDGKTLTVADNATVSGTNTGDQVNISGNAATATALQNSVNINGVAFNGTSNITISSSPTSLITVEVNIGAMPRKSGRFTITSSGLTSGKALIINQAVGPYTNKGSRQDEAEMDGLIVSGIVTNATTIQCYWRAPTFVVGNFKFNYFIGS